MAKQSLTDVLDACLTMLGQGKRIEDCMLAYPDAAGLLDAPLRAAQTLHSARGAVDASVPAPSSRRDLILRAAAAQASVARPVAAGGAQDGAPAAGDWFATLFQRLVAVPYALPVLAAIVILGGAALGVSAATGRPAGPGWFAGSSKDNRVELRGTITAITADSITIATADGEVTAAITPQTEFDGPPGDFAVGDSVKLSAFPGADGSLVASEIEHEEEDEDEAPVTPGATARPDDDNSGPGNADDPEDDDRSGPGAGEDDDRSGPNRGPEDDGEDRSGSGGSHEDSGDNSGPGGDDANDDSPEHQNGEVEHETPEAGEHEDGHSGSDSHDGGTEQHPQEDEQHDESGGDQHTDDHGGDR